MFKSNPDALSYMVWSAIADMSDTVTCYVEAATYTGTTIMISRHKSCIRQTFTADEAEALGRELILAAQALRDDISPAISAVPSSIQVGWSSP